MNELESAHIDLNIFSVKWKQGFQLILSAIPNVKFNSKVEIIKHKPTKRRLDLKFQQNEEKEDIIHGQHMAI